MALRGFPSPCSRQYLLLCKPHFAFELLLPSICSNLPSPLSISMLYAIMALHSLLSCSQQYLPLYNLHFVFVPLLPTICSNKSNRRSWLSTASCLVAHRNTCSFTIHHFVLKFLVLPYICLTLSSILLVSFTSFPFEVSCKFYSLQTFFSHVSSKSSSLSL